jgi:hypothetical protein
MMDAILEGRFEVIDSIGRDGPHRPRQKRRRCR